LLLSLVDEDENDNGEKAAKRRRRRKTPVLTRGEQRRVTKNMFSNDIDVTTHFFFYCVFVFLIHFVFVRMMIMVIMTIMIIMIDKRKKKLFQKSKENQFKNANCFSLCFESE
jgi:hypothetical protein